MKLRMQWPPSKVYHIKTLGSLLSEFYEEHCKQCGFGMLNPMGDFLSPDLFSPSELNHRIEAFPVSGDKLFFYIFHENDFSQKPISYEPNPYRIIETDFPNRISLDTKSNFFSSYFVQSCNGYYQRISNLYPDGPISVLQAASSADNDPSRQGSVVMLKGEFRNPLVPHLFQRQTSTHQLYGWLWRFYGDHPEFADRSYILNHFQGVLYKRFESANERWKLDQDGFLNMLDPISYPDANINWQSVWELHNSENWKAAGIIESGNDEYYNSHFTRLPAPGDIIDYFSRIPSKVLSKAPIKENQPYELKLFYPGLPVYMAEGYWFLENWDSTIFVYRPLFNSSYHVDENGTSGCLITLTGYVKPIYFHKVNLNDQLLLKFTFKGRDDAAMNGRPLRLKAQAHIDVSNHPMLEYQADRVNFLPEAISLARFKLKWEVPVYIVDKENSVDPDRPIKLLKVEIDRSGWSQDLPVEGRIVRSNEVASKFDLNILTEWSYPNNYFDGSRNDKTYLCSGTLALPLISGGSVQRKFAFTIRYPHVRRIPKTENKPTIGDQSGSFRRQ